LSLIEKVIPVVVVDNPDSAVKLAKLYKSVGISAIEITLRTKTAIDCVRAVKDSKLDLRLGVGTITDVDQAQVAASLGADFLVSPATSEGLLKFASETPLPMYLGFSTVSEALRLLESGLTVAKFFPAEAAGGAPFVQSLAAVLPNLHLFPTGGIQLSNLADYLDLPNVLQIGGTWLAPKRLIAQGEWRAIEEILQKTQQYLANYERNEK
jgi:2-dehydro-3-deoxyphosphogluconate aldolase/(4S)-4-hydroxy-2-oxoglutarate aldolase